MSKTVWSKAIVDAAVPERARRAYEASSKGGSMEILAKASAEQARTFCALWSGSEWATELLLKHPEWMPSLETSHLGHARQVQGLRRDATEFIKAALDAGFSETLGKLRQFKQREMIRIAARDLARLAPTAEIILELSNVADVCLADVLKLCLQQFTARIGRPFEQDADGNWRASRFCVLGLGKLGGQELNYSSDVDVLFVYSDEGAVFKEAPRKGKTSRPGMSNHEFFKRVAESFIAEVGRFTSDGALFRIDLRLRPEGEAGPLVRSLSSYENYYAQWGQTWERMMLIKARCVAGDLGVAGEFLEMVQPFRYPRSVSENVLNEIAAVKQRIESEVVKSGEMERNVKLGRGGIREIEFIAQALQILSAGRNPFLQGAQTLPVLQKLAQYDLLEMAEVDALSRAYSFLRDVEHRLQMEQNRQTHSLPASSAARERIARLMGFEDFIQFERARASHSNRVRAVYEKILKRSTGQSASEWPKEFDGREAEWQSLLEKHSFREPGSAAKLLREFVLGPGYGHVSARTTELAMRLLPKMLSFCPQRGGKNEAGNKSSTERSPIVFASPTVPSRSRSRAAHPILSDPDRVVARLDAFVSAYGARATLYELWSSNTALFELMLFLFDRSEFLAEVAIRTPDLVDELMLSGHLQRRKTAEVILEELRHGVRDNDQRLWIRRYHQSELMRIGLRDILGLADYEQNFEELSALADACLHYSLEVVMRKHKMKSPPFAIIGWGNSAGLN